jgi:RND family efflux transporter MFP subunit
VIASRTETDLAFRIGGKMVTRLVDAGDRVKAGDVIARLDPEDLTLQLESAEAEFAAATSSLAQASADRDRFDTLKAQGHATAADYDRKALARDEAAARLERAERTLSLAKRQVAYAELKADVDGVVTATAAEPGQVVAVGQPIATLAHLDGKEAVVALPEDWFAHAAEANATVSLWSDSARHLDAHLRELSPEADPATRTYAARFAIADADDSIAFGMTATVTLTRQGGAPVARLPLAAILNKGEGPAVYVVRDHALALAPVKVAAFTEDTATITSGVSDGDQVVTLGVQKLEPGEQVRTVDAH